MTATIVEQLSDGPLSSRELGVHPKELRLLAAQGVVKIDKDMFPDQYVPGNPFIARLPDDPRPWWGWEHWNL